LYKESCEWIPAPDFRVEKMTIALAARADFRYQVHYGLPVIQA
jgi:hypothetical protein